MSLAWAGTGCGAFSCTLPRSRAESSACPSPDRSGQIQKHLTVSKSGLFAPSIHQNEHFTKTGSGQTHRENFVCSLVRTGSQPVFGVTGLLWPISCHQKPPIGTTFLISAAFDSWYLLRAIKYQKSIHKQTRGKVKRSDARYDYLASGWMCCSEQIRGNLQQNGLFECFPYVCPEPVFGKMFVFI
jgi:hypothetical protein